MRKLYLLAGATALSMVAFSSACTVTTANDDGGSGGATASSGMSSSSSLMGPMSSSSTGGSTPTFDQPGAASFATDFNIVDNGDGTYSVNGVWAIDLIEFDGNNLGDTLCTEQFAFTADIELPMDLQGCDDNGMNCTTICPFDDPGEAIDPTGACIGHFANLVGDASSYQTDCNFENETDWFHPDGGGMPLLENFFLSMPVEDAVPSGADMYPLWGDWAQAVEDANAGYLRAAQVQFVNANNDDNGMFLNWSNAGFMFGVTASPDGAEMTTDGVGNHVMINAFVLTFGG